MNDQVHSNPNIPKTEAVERGVHGKHTAKNKDARVLLQHVYLL